MNNKQLTEIMIKALEGYSADMKKTILVPTVDMLIESLKEELKKSEND